MRYVKVVFLKEVGAFKGRDGAVYGPYKPREEAIIPEEDARELALKGLVATIGCYAVGDALVDVERRVEPIELIGLARELEILALTSTIPVIAFLSLTPLTLAQTSSASTPRLHYIDLRAGEHRKFLSILSS
jgi:hypothetical protein